MKNSSQYWAFLCLLFLISSSLYAQLTPCRGPNLWYNGDFEQSNDLIASGWNPFCLPPFYDVITADTPGFLYPDITDHTPGTGTHFLWSDHSLTPCVFFPIGSDVNILTQTIPTTVGETYHFGVWCYTWCFNVGAEFGLAIDGTIVLTQNLNAIPNCTKGWKYYSYDWVATDSSTDFGVIDVNWQLFGWDMAFDDLEVYQLPNLEITAGPDTTLCTGTCTPLWVRGEGIESVVWSGGVLAPTDTLTSACPTQETQFSVIAKDEFGCLDTAFVLVKTTIGPLVDLGEDLVFCENDCDTLSFNASNNIQIIEWSTGANTQNIEICYGADPKIYVTVTENNCQGIDSVNVLSIPKPSIGLVSVTCNSNFLNYQLVFSTQNSNTSIVSEGILTNLANNTFLVKNIDINNSITIEASQDGLCPVTLTIDPPSCACPNIPAPINGGDIEICFEENIPSLAVSSIAGTKVNWFANPIGGNPIAILTNAYLPTQAGIFYAEAIDTVNNCVSATRTAVKLTKRAEIIANAGTDKIICENTCTTLSAIGGVTFQWSNGFTTPTISSCPLVLTKYIVTVSDVFGCTDIDSVEVNIETFPSVTAQTPICEPDLLSWSVKVTLPNNAQLDVPIGTVTLASVNSFLIKDLPKAQNCTLFVQSAMGLCTDTVEIIAPICECPNIQPPASPGEYKICADKTFPNFNVTVGLGLKADWYATPSGGIPLSQNTTTFTPTQAGTYYAEARDPINGCVSAERSPVTLTLLPLPVIGLPDTLAIACGLDYAILDADNASVGSNFMNQWTFPTGVTPLILNNNPLKLQITKAGLYILEIKNTLTQCVNTDTTLVLKTDIPEVTFSTEQPACYGETGVLSIQSTQNGLPPYQYSLDAGLTFNFDTVFSGLLPNNYSFLVKDATDCGIDTTFTIIAPQEIALQLDSTITILLGNTVTLSAQLGIPLIAVDTIFWLPSEGFSCLNCLKPTIKPIEENIYSITVQDLNGCLTTDSILVKISREVPKLYAPNALKAEGNEGNDHFTLFAREGLVDKIIALRIWNRWGELVFEKENFDANNPDLGWNGTYRKKNAPSGVYAWWAKVVLIDGSEIIEKGEVTVIR
jgi:CHU_C Type IX secretion signal domain/Ig-like domain CHU_C associated